MSVQPLFAEETISITKLRTQLAKVLKRKRPVAILSHNETAGYIVNAEVFARLVELAELAAPGIRAEFRPSAARLRQITAASAAILLESDDKQLAEFEEH